MDKFGKGKIDIDFAIRGGGGIFLAYILRKSTRTACCIWLMAQ